MYCDNVCQGRTCHWHFGKCQMGWSIFSLVGLSNLDFLCKTIVIWLIMVASRNNMGCCGALEGKKEPVWGPQGKNGPVLEMPGAIFGPSPPLTAAMISSCSDSCRLSYL